MYIHTNNQTIKTILANFKWHFFSICQFTYKTLLTEPSERNQVLWICAGALWIAGQGHYVPRPVRCKLEQVSLTFDVVLWQ